MSVSLKRLLILFLLVFLVGILCLIDGFYIEPHWLAVRRKRVEGLGALSLLHFSDVHFKGDRRYLAKVIRAINRQDVDFVCFTGDLVEFRGRFDTALAYLEQIRHPVYAVPGNHEHWARVDFKRFDAALRKTGGRLLVNESVRFREGVSIVGLDDAWVGRPDVARAFEGTDATKRIVLFHEPFLVERFGGRSYALALAGHSHGGQVRLPFIGALILPRHTGRYDRGLYRLPIGPLHVTTGVGTFDLEVRFLCRPEIVVLRGK